jgi:hypothetical protein
VRTIAGRDGTISLLHEQIRDLREALHGASAAAAAAAAAGTSPLRRSVCGDTDSSVSNTRENLAGGRRSAGAASAMAARGRGVLERGDPEEMELALRDCVEELERRPAAAHAPAADGGATAEAARRGLMALAAEVQRRDLGDAGPLVPAPRAHCAARTTLANSVIAPFNHRRTFSHLRERNIMPVFFVISLQ